MTMDCPYEGRSLMKWLFSWLKALQFTGPLIHNLLNLTIGNNFLSWYFGFHSQKSFHPLLLGGRQETNHSNVKATYAKDLNKRKVHKQGYLLRSLIP